MAAWIIPVITTVVGFLSDGVKGFFGAKQANAEALSNTVNKVTEAARDANLSSSEREKAIASVIQSETSSGYWLAAVWRPLMMVIFGGLIVAYGFGWTTPVLLLPIPADSFMGYLFEIFKYGILGYMPARTVEKIALEFIKSKAIVSALEKLAKK